MIENICSDLGDTAFLIYGLPIFLVIFSFSVMWHFPISLPKFFLYFVFVTLPSPVLNLFECSFPPKFVTVSFFYFYISFFMSYHLHISIVSLPSVSHSHSSFYHQHPDPGFQIHTRSTNEFFKQCIIWSHSFHLSCTTF